MHKEFGVKLFCPKCQYTWDYAKPSWNKVKCPRCGEKVEIPDPIKKFVGVYHPPIQYDFGEF